LRILLLTGKLAEPAVRNAVSMCPPRHEIKVLVMPIDVAALATPQSIVSYLKKIRPKDYDLIMVSGAVQGSMKTVEDAVGVKTVKGPKHAVDIPMLLEAYDPEKLSPDVPADTLLIKELREHAKSILEEVERSIASKPNINVGGTLIPIDPPPIRVISEVADAHLLKEEELLRAVRRRIEDGADIISLGFQAGVANPGKVEASIRLIKREYDLPLALDSIIPSEIIAGVEAGIDMVMSLEAGNIRKVADKIQHIPVVVIPYDSERNLFARTIEDKLRLLELNLENASKHNVKNLIADPVLEPINLRETAGLFHSLMAYYRFKRERPEIPMMMGLCNVAELIDVDSIGVNAILTMLAAEIGVSTVLIVEKSPKTARSTAEAKISAQMAAIAWGKGTPPKDLGLNLLIFKNKRMIETDLGINGAEIVETHEQNEGYPKDPLGFFRVTVNHEDEVIEVLYSGVKGKILIKGGTARSIYGEILRRGLLSMLSHALYLGVELGKAEEALRTGKSYVQEENLFERMKPITTSK